MEHAGTEQYPLAKSSIRHDENIQLHSIADSDSRPDNRTGSRQYELNVWLWNYGRSLLRPISVAQTASGDRTHLNIINIHKYHEYSRLFLNIYFTK